MKKTVVRIFIGAISILILAYLLPGVSVSGIGAALVASVIIGLVNGFIKPIVTFFTIPITILTLGLFLFVINACMILLADKLVPGFHVNTFWWALIFSILLSFVNSIFQNLAEEKLGQ